MTHEIEPVEDYWRGDTRHLVFIVWDGDAAEPNTRKVLDGATIDWWLTRHRDRDLGPEMDGVSIVMTNPGTGEFEVRIAAGATEPLPATLYRERLRITDAQGRRTTYGSSFRVQAP